MFWMFLGGGRKLEDMKETHVDLEIYVENMWNSAEVFLVIWVFKFKCFTCILHHET